MDEFVSKLISSPYRRSINLNQLRSDVLQGFRQLRENDLSGNTKETMKISLVAQEPLQHSPVDSSPSTFTTHNNNQMIPGVSQEQSQAGLPDPKITPLQGVAPLGPVQLTPEQEAQRLNLEEAFQHMPYPGDSEAQRRLPAIPCPTPAYYPQQPMAQHGTLDHYMKLSAETLFFNFYCLGGTEA